MTKDEIIKILQDAIDYREKDIQERQIDIDNYIASIQIVESEYSDDPNMDSYKSYLSELLRTGLIEQTKMKIFLKAAKINLAKLQD